MKFRFTFLLMLMAMTSLTANTPLMAAKTYPLRNGLYCSVNETDKTATIVYDEYYIDRLTTADIPSYIEFEGEPYKVAAIDEGAFYKLPNLTKVSIPNTIEKIGPSAFFGCTGLTSVSLPNSVKSIGGNTFENCTNLTTVELGNSVEQIGAYAFSKCSSLKSIKIPDSTLEIPSYCFNMCYHLTKVELGSSVKSIGKYAFYSCSDFTEITIPNSVEIIQTYAFWDCTLLNTITLGSSLKSIDGNVFNSMIKSVTCLSSTPPVIGQNTFQYILATLHVPSGCASAYKNAPVWRTFTPIYEDAPTVAVTSISLNKTNLTLEMGEYVQLVATVLPENATNKEVTWTSSHSSIVNVSRDGVIGALYPGTATITASCGNKSATCTVTVKNPEVKVTWISLDKKTLSLKVGETSQLKATITPANATNQTVIWTSTNPSVATVSSSGLVTAKSAGTAKIDATIDGFVSSCNVTVEGTPSSGPAGTAFTFTSASSTNQTKGDISVKIDKASGLNEPFFSTSGELRLYANNTITVTGKNITSIELTFTKQGTKDYATLTASPGTLKSGGVSTSNTNYVTDIWTGSASKVTFTLGNPGQRIVTKIVVHEANANGVDDISAEDPELPVEVYNMQGVRVYIGLQEDMNLDPGLYIIRQGSKSTKIIVQ